MISLIIPTNNTNKEYTRNLISNITELYPDRSKVEIVLEENSGVTLGVNYNNAVLKSKGDKIILLHNDMVLSPNFIETMDKYIQKGRITSYTRVEPPIYKDTYPGKVLLDCGDNLSNFNYDKFINLNVGKSLKDGGSQLFFGCMKEDYLGIDGNTFKMFCEDDDLHLRYKMLGFEYKVSPSKVYHFVSKTSRTTPNYQKIEANSNKNFIRKWGKISRDLHIPKYDIGFKVINCSLNLLEALEPWCSNILIDDEVGVITSHYLDKEQPNTITNLTKKIKSTPFDVLENEIVVEINNVSFLQQDFITIQQLPEIIKDSGGIGEFELGNLKVKINQMNEYQNDLIKL